MKSFRVRKPTTHRNRARVLVFGKYLRAPAQEAQHSIATSPISHRVSERMVSTFH